MPGMPRRRASLVKLRQMTNAEFASILVDYAQGTKPLQRVLDERGVVMLGWRTYLNEHPECKAAWQEAKRCRAESLAEASLGIADGADATNAANVRKAQLQVAARHWLASRYDPGQFGAKAEAVVSVGELFLAAAQEVNREDWARRMRAQEASRHAEARIEEGAVPTLPEGDGVGPVGGVPRE